MRGEALASLPGGNGQDSDRSGSGALGPGVSFVTSMEPFFFVLIALLLFTIVFGPIFGAESRPGFRRPDRKPRPMMGALRPSDWDKQGWDR
jgi:hypothetical protein